MAEFHYTPVFQEYEYTFTPVVRESSSFAASFSEHRNTVSTISYQNSNYGTSIPTGVWSETPDPKEGKYLWTKTELSFTDGSTSTVYSVGYIGANGTGSVKSVNGLGGEVTIDGRNIYVDSSMSPPQTIKQKFAAIENNVITKAQIDALFE